MNQPGTVNVNWSWRLLPGQLTDEVSAEILAVSMRYGRANWDGLNAMAKREKAEKELQMATQIQLDALPTTAPDFKDFPNLNLRGSMNTAREVGGDFYDYFPIDENRLCFLIADVSGKGTPAALFMMTAKTMIKDYTLNLNSTSEIFTAVNARLCESNEAGMFATAWIGIVDKRTMTLQYTNAGHNYPLLQRKGQPCEIVKKTHGLFLAGMEFTRYRQEEIQLEPGDRLLLYTDGTTEARAEDGRFFGEDGLRDAVMREGALGFDGLLDRLLATVEAFTGNHMDDDVAMVALRFDKVGDAL
jgi:serine phosphatase RsbU (regulator of sigma subunit)